MLESHAYFLQHYMKDGGIRKSGKSHNMENKFVWQTCSTCVKIKTICWKIYKYVFYKCIFYNDDLSLKIYIYCMKWSWVVHFLMYFISNQCQHGL